MVDYLASIYVFVIGLAVGSFLNVCIYRLPLQKSVIRPARSFCPNCNTAIRAYDNIPLLSYLWLRGRCRYCGVGISPRYPIVETLTAIMALAVYSRFGPSFPSLVYFLFIAALLVITYIDLDHQIIPDVISLPGIAIGLVTSFFLPRISGLDSLFGILVGGGSLFLVGQLYQLLARREGLGMGDVKLLAMIGAFIGWQGVMFTIMASSMLGTMVGLVVMIQKRSGMKMAIPYGPFLSIGAMLYLFWGPELVAWYFGML